MFLHKHRPIGAQVCGDAVLVLPACPEAAACLQQRVAALAAKHTGACSGARRSSKRPSVDTPTAQQGRSREQQQLMQRLLRRPSGGAAPAAVAVPHAERAAAEPAPPAAPGTPRLGEVAGPGSSGGGDGSSMAALRQRQQLHWGQGDAACQQRQQGQQAAHEARVFECEPRQALLWSIAGRATSLSWQSSGTAGTAGAAGGGPPTAAAPAPQHDSPGPALQQSAAAAASAAPPAAPVLQPPPASALQPPLAAVEPPPPATQRSQRSSLDRSPWADLQPEVLGLVLHQAGQGAETARAASQVCRSWRQGLAGERGALQRLRFAALRWRGGDAGCSDSCGAGSAAGASNGGCTSSSQAAGSGRSGGSASTGCGDLRLPWLVQLAVKAGNLAATVAAARFLEGRLRALHPQHEPRLQARRGAGEEWAAAVDAASWHGRAARAGHAGGLEADLARLWAKAAKLGHPEAQWKVGYAHYKVRRWCALPAAPALLCLLCLAPGCRKLGLASLAGGCTAQVLLPGWCLACLYLCKPAVACARSAHHRQSSVGRAVQGLLGLPRDGEESLLWLNRAARQLIELLGEDAGSTGSSSGAGAGAGAGSSGGDPDPARCACQAAGAGRVLPALLSAAACRHILAQVG